MNVNKRLVASALLIGLAENALIRSLQHDRLLTERVERLMSIPAIGPITALTWASEIRWR